MAILSKWIVNGIEYEIGSVPDFVRAIAIGVSLTDLSGRIVLWSAPIRSREAKVEILTADEIKVQVEEGVLDGQTIVSCPVRSGAS